MIPQLKSWCQRVDMTEQKELNRGQKKRLIEAANKFHQGIIQANERYKLGIVGPIEADYPPFTLVEERLINELDFIMATTTEHKRLTKRYVDELKEAAPEYVNMYGAMFDFDGATWQ